MKKALKWIFWTGATAVVILAIGATYLALTFDPNRYKPELERLVKEQTGRTLKLPGKIALTFYPSVGARISGLSLSERSSDQEFLSLESAVASVKVLPLLRGEVIVDAIRITGLKARIVQGKDGHFNFDDLLAGGEPAAPASPPAKPAAKADAKAEPKGAAKAAVPAAAPAGKGAVSFQVAGVRVERAAIDYRDLAAGSELSLSDLRFSTGRIAEKAGGKLALTALAKGRNPDLDLKVDLEADYALDLPDGVRLSKLQAKLGGAAAGLTGLDLAADGDLGFDLKRNQARAGNLQLAFKGANGADRVEGTIRLGDARGSERTLSIPKLAVDVTVTSADLPAAIRPLRLPLTGSVNANFAKQTASAELEGKIDESTIKAKIGLTRFAPASYSFDLDVDRLNIDRYLAAEKAPAPAPAAGAPKPAPSSPAPATPVASAKPVAGKPGETPVDLAPLKDVNGAGKLRIGALQVRGLRLSDFRAELSAAAGRVDVSPHSARLYDGSVAGDLTLDANGNRVALKETLTDVSIGPLMKDIADKDYVAGKGSVAMDVKASGPTVEAMKRSLAGTARVNLREGTLSGFDALDILKKAQSIVGAQTSQGSGKGARTDFGELKATFTIADGVAKNGDLDVQAPGLRIVGSGTIDIGRSRVDYRMNPRLVTNNEGRGVEAPVHLSGSFDDLQYEVNYGQVVRDVVRNVGRKLKGLLGR